MKVKKLERKDDKGSSGKHDRREGEGIADPAADVHSEDSSGEKPSGRSGPLPSPSRVFQRPTGPESDDDVPDARLPGDNAGSGPVPTPLEQRLGPPPPGPVSLRMQARIDSIARQVLQCHTVEEIAAEGGIKPKRVREIIQSDEFREAYLKVREEFYDKLDEVIRNERLKPLFRAQAQAIRAQSAVTDTMELIHERVKERTAKATEMRVLMDLAFGIIDRSNNEISLSARKYEKSAVQVNVLNVSPEHASLMQDTFEEAGIKLDDVLPTEDVIDVIPETVGSPPDEDRGDA